MKYADALNKISEDHDTVTSRLLPLFVPYAALSIWLSRKEPLDFNPSTRTVMKEVEK